MSIFNEIFDRCYHELAGSATRQVREAYERKRYNRALLALRSQNHFLSCSFTNESGAAGVTGSDRTLPLERTIILRGGGMNAIFIGGSGAYFDVYDGGAVNVKVSRSGSSRAQISKEFVRSSHFFSQGEAQKFALDWPVPITLDPNEIIQVLFEQVSATTANTIYAIGFYGVTVDPVLRCDSSMLDSVRRQVAKGGIQKPRYLHLKTDDGAGTIDLPSIASNVRAVANTIEVPEHMLVLGWRRWMVGMNTHLGAAPSTTARLVVTGGPSFSRIEIPIKAFEYFANPDSGFFKFAVPHFVPQGSSISLSITSTIEDAEQQFQGEIELLCVSV